MIARTLHYLNHPDYAEGRAAEQAGQPWKRWQTAAWRAGWGQARTERRDREFMAHERVLRSRDGCQDPGCSYPYCVQVRERVAAVNGAAA